MSKRKYHQVKRITSLADFEQSQAKCFDVVHNTGRRVWHRGALESLQVRTLIRFIKERAVYELAENEVKEVAYDDVIVLGERLKAMNGNLAELQKEQMELFRKWGEEQNREEGRNQYDKGFSDGYKVGTERAVRKLISRYIQISSGRTGGWDVRDVMWLNEAAEWINKECERDGETEDRKTDD